MRLPRLFLRGARPGARVVAADDDFRHVIVVLRRGPGDEVVVLDGEGGAYRGAIENVDGRGRSFEVRVGEAVLENEPPPLSLEIAVAVPRGDGMELAVRLGSETGIAVLRPLVTARTVVRAAAGSSKLERWRRIARESAEQCRRARPLEVADPLSWEELLRGAAPAAAAGRLWMALPGGPWPASAGFAAAVAGAAGAAAPLIVVVGPEGGLAPEEIDAGLAAGLRPLGLPAPILRTPTAVVYIGALAGWIAVEPEAATAKTDAQA